MNKIQPVFLMNEDMSTSKVNANVNSGHRKTIEKRLSEFFLTGTYAMEMSSLNESPDVLVFLQSMSSLKYNTQDPQLMVQEASS